jgi:hypothetical protein
LRITLLRQAAEKTGLYHNLWKDFKAIKRVEVWRCDDPKILDIACFFLVVKLQIPVMSGGVHDC